jgi:4-amino-4-deoxy-L-arabinose transferase-like glycosyltransferase
MFKFPSGVGRFSWRGLSLLTSVICICFAFFFWRLSSLTPGLSPAEANAKSSSRFLHPILQDPVYAPHKILQHLSQAVKPENIAALRLPSVIFALVCCFCFYKLAVSWFGRAIGLFSSLIFATLPLMIISARQASPEITFFSPIIFMWLYTWLVKQRSNKSLAWFLTLFAAAIFIYTPGLLVWLLLTFIVARRKILAAISAVPIWVSALGLFLVASSLGVIASAAIKHLDVLKSIALVPPHTDGAIGILKVTGWMVSSLFVRTGHSDSLVLGRLPILNILLLALMVFGVYAMQGVARRKAAALGSLVLFAVLAAGINDNVAMLAMAIPALAIFIAAGLRYLYIEWRSIFPRNPVPKTFALALIAAVSASQIYFGLHYALVAWPHSAATRTVYVLK